MTNGVRPSVQPEDLVRFITIPDAQISPDGSRAAYVRNWIDAERDEYRSAVWVVSLDGPGAASGDPAGDGAADTPAREGIQFTAGQKRDTAPRWSPDGRFLAFLSDREEKAQLYVMPATGGEPRRLTDLPDGAGTPVWSPDGRHIAFAASVQREPAPEDEKAKARWKERPRHVDLALYKRDGSGYTYDRFSHIFVVTAGETDGGMGGHEARPYVPTHAGPTASEPRQITDGLFDDYDPAWSADGQSIVFCSARHENREHDTLVDLYLIPAAGGEARSLARLGRLSAPAFSPDGRSIGVYATTDDGRDWSAHHHVWLVPAGGGEARDLMPELDRGVPVQPPPFVTPRPAWSADGTRVLFALVDSGDTNLHSVAVADGSRTEITRGERQIPVWSLAAASGRVAFVFSDLETPADLVVTEVEGGEERRLTRLNESLLGELVYRPPQRRRFSTPHGEIDGWVLRPANAERPGPLLLDIHGGPHSFWGSLFPINPFYWLVAASRGWTLLALNPTGSGSYGQEFARTLLGRWGEYDLPEQMAAVDALIAEGVADPERLAVTGYSYGGYMTSWTVGHTDRFKAAVIGAPVTNLESFHGTSDIGMWFGPFEMGGPLVEGREVFRRLSPVNYIDRVTTPCLVLHGEADDRCPIGQGEEWFIGLRALGRMAEMVRYPGQSHAFRGTGRPSHRVDYVQRLIAWIERYTLGAAEGEKREMVSARPHAR